MCSRSQDTRLFRVVMKNAQSVSWSGSPLLGGHLRTYKAPRRRWWRWGKLTTTRIFSRTSLTTSSRTPWLRSRALTQAHPQSMCQRVISTQCEKNRGGSKGSKLWFLALYYSAFVAVWSIHFFICWFRWFLQFVINFILFIWFLNWCVIIKYSPIYKRATKRRWSATNRRRIENKPDHLKGPRGRKPGWHPALQW